MYLPTYTSATTLMNCALPLIQNGLEGTNLTELQRVTFKHQFKIYRPPYTLQNLTQPAAGNSISQS